MYIQKEILSGDMLERIKSVKCDRPGMRGRKRAAKQNLSSEAMQRRNRAMRCRILARLLSANFTRGDHFIYLTFRDAPPERQEAAKLVKNFIRRLKAKYNRSIKYLYIIEEGARNGRLHIHLVLNGEVPLSTVAECWTYGRVRNEAIYSRSNMRTLAKYLLKNQNAPNTRAWSCSKNLIKPVEKAVEVNHRSFRRKPAELLHINGAAYQLCEWEEHIDNFTLETVQYAVYFKVPEPDRHKRLDRSQRAGARRKQAAGVRQKIDVIDWESGC